MPVIEGSTPKLLPKAPSAPVNPPAPPGALYREDVDRVLSQGFPSFLQRVDVEAHVRDGKFVGWTLVALYPSDFWAGVDLQPGDVVTQVNAKPIERETEAFDCFQSLKDARRLKISFLRGGASREIDFAIIPRPGPSVAQR